MEQDILDANRYKIIKNKQLSMEDVSDINRTVNIIRRYEKYLDTLANWGYDGSRCVSLPGMGTIPNDSFQETLDPVYNNMVNKYNQIVVNELRDGYKAELERLVAHLLNNHHVVYSTPSQISDYTDGYLANAKITNNSISATQMAPHAHPFAKMSNVISP